MAINIGATVAHSIQGFMQEREMARRQALLEQEKAKESARADTQLQLQREAGARETQRMIAQQEHDKQVLLKEQAHEAAMLKAQQETASYARAKDKVTTAGENTPVPSGAAGAGIREFFPEQIIAASQGAPGVSITPQVPAIMSTVPTPPSFVDQTKAQPAAAVSSIPGVLNIAPKEAVAEHLRPGAAWAEKRQEAEERAAQARITMLERASVEAQRREDKQAQAAITNELAQSRLDLNRIVGMGNLSARNKSLDDILNEDVGSAPPAVKEVISSATLGIKQPRLQSRTQRTLAASYDEADPSLFKSQVRQTVLNQGTAPERRATEGRRDMIEALIAVQGQLDAFKASGKYTNIFSGTAEDIARKLGTTTDPELVKINSQLAGILQSYRHDMTGAVFSKQESQQYEALMPSKSNVPVLNKALIDQFKTSLQREDRGFWEERLGKRGAVFINGTTGRDAKTETTQETYDRLMKGQ